jgi:hypothetical protein
VKRTIHSPKHGPKLNQQAWHFNPIALNSTLFSFILGIFQAGMGLAIRTRGISKTFDTSMATAILSSKSDPVTTDSG